MSWKGSEQSSQYKRQEQPGLYFTVSFRLVQLQVTEITSNQLEKKEQEGIQWKGTEESQRYKETVKDRNQEKNI